MRRGRKAVYPPEVAGPMAGDKSPEGA